MTETIERRFTQQLPRYFDLFVPEGAGPFPLIIGMHGYGGDKQSMMRLMRRINETEYAIASLQAPFQHIVIPDDREQSLGFGFGWLTNFKSQESVDLHFDAVRYVLSLCAEHKRIDASGAFLLGFSQSVALNLKFAFTDPELVRGVVGICGGIPGDWTTNESYREGDFDVLIVAGTTDEFYPPDRCEQNRKALESRARTVELMVYEAGHEIPRDACPAIDAWLGKRAAESGA